MTSSVRCHVHCRFRRSPNHCPAPAVYDCARELATVKPLHKQNCRVVLVKSFFTEKFRYAKHFEVELILGAFGRILPFAPGAKLISEVTTSLQAQAAKLGRVQLKTPLAFDDPHLEARLQAASTKENSSLPGGGACNAWVFPLAFLGGSCGCVPRHLAACCLGVFPSSTGALCCQHSSSRWCCSLFRLLSVVLSIPATPVDRGLGWSH